MPYALGDYVRFYKLPAGRAAFALRQIAELAPGFDVPRLVEAVEVALHQALTLEAQELGPDPRSTLFTPEASELDAQIDRLLAAIEQTLEAHIRSGSELAALATTTHDTLFPRGVAPLTRQPFIEEHESVTQLLVTLDTLAPAIATLGLNPFVTPLKSLNERQGEALKASTQPQPSAAALRTARAALHRSVLEVIARILGTWPGEDEASVNARATLLAPLNAQAEALAAHYRERNTPKAPTT